jgi:hypothetical protein
MNDNEVMIVFNGQNQQPVILQGVGQLEIKRDNILVSGYSFRKIYFKDSIHSIETGQRVKVFIR